MFQPQKDKFGYNLQFLNSGFTGTFTCEMFSRSIDTLHKTFRVLLLSETVIPGTKKKKKKCVIVKPKVFYFILSVKQEIL